MGERAVDMNQGQGGRERIYMRQNKRWNALEPHFDGGSATCSDDDVAARNRKVENGLCVSAPFPPGHDGSQRP